MNNPAAKPTCSFCPGAGHTWAVEDNQRACFVCLRRQRAEYRTRVEALERRVDYTEHVRHADGALMGLKGDLRHLGERIQRLLSQLEEQP